MGRISWIVSWIARKAPGILFVASVPVLLITASVTYAVNDSGLYNRGFQRYQVSTITGITGPDLVQAGAALREYFNSRRTAPPPRWRHGVGSRGFLRLA